MAVDVRVVIKGDVLWAYLPHRPKFRKRFSGNGGRWFTGRRPKLARFLPDPVWLIERPEATQMRTDDHIIPETFPHLRVFSWGIDETNHGRMTSRERRSVPGFLTGRIGGWMLARWSNPHPSRVASLPPLLRQAQNEGYSIEGRGLRASGGCSRVPRVISPWTGSG